MKNFKICEIFYSVQGEGDNIGVPSIFIRLFGCNLQCTFCDTKFSWDPKFAKYTNMSIDQISAEISKYPGAQNIVFTGGEPALFQDEIKTIQEVINKQKPDFTYELETNGSFPIKHGFWNTINISPKLSNSGNKKYKVRAHENQEIQKIFWKFVINSREDLPEIINFKNEYKLENKNIFLMPQAQTLQEISQKSAEIIEICKEFSFRFCPRLHIFIYSDKKGV